MLDVIVIGSGPGGMTAALYAARAGLSAAIIEQGIPGGQMNNTEMVENYPGFVSILGSELGQKMFENVKNEKVENIYGVVTGIEDKGDVKVVKTTDNEYQARAVVIATGSTHRQLEVPGEQEYSGRGVSYCAVCDGAFFRDKEIVVIGGGDSAVEEGIYLAGLAKHVTIVHRRDTLRAIPTLQKRAFDNDKISFVWNAQTEAIEGDDMKVTQVRYLDKETKEEKTLPADGVFIYVGLLPNSDPFLNLGITDEHGWIETKDDMSTAVPGIFAIGDVRKKGLRQITTAVGDGAVVGQSVFKYLELK